MKENLKNLVSDAIKDIESVIKEADLLNVKSKYLGKKSELFNLMSSLKDKSVEEKKELGSLLNKIKIDLEKKIEEKLDSLNIKEISFDETLPVDESIGSLHPVTIVAKEVTDILSKMGFIIVGGPEMEKEYYNFNALNIPENHPARDMTDTYWLSNGDLLRTHTSPCQVRAIEKYGAPLRICAPGRVFRNEDIDASHENTFFQLEGMVIDENISISNLIYVMEGMLKEIFHKDIRVRLRSGFFPFVEPGFELDCSCMICDGDGCTTCKNSGWVELCPCGMVHPSVLEISGVDSNKYSGFAFGIGLTRLAMMKYKINDIRCLNQGDLRVLEKFNEE